ncbi:MAG TPA: hypothetical protein VE136_04190 [Anaerolineales bacterium]|nr:hypothetical protein [Anaerolineales bacterium]
MKESSTLRIRQVTDRGDVRKFVKFPWKVYQEDPNWVPPLLADQVAKLDPNRGSFYNHGEAVLFLAQREGELTGTIAALVDRRFVEHTGQKVGGFGFFEVLEDYAAANRLLEAACEWLREQDMEAVSGPNNFSDLERPGVLIEGDDCPPVMLQAHTPLYYKDFLERFGMQKDHDLYAWRAHRSQIGEGFKNVPPQLARVAEAAKRNANVNIRRVRIEKWDEEIHIAYELFVGTLDYLPEHMPIKEDEFHEFADPMKTFLDPDLALLAEVDGRAIGFIVALPDINQVLIHLNGRLFPFGWLKVKPLVRKIDTATFKLMGLVEEYRHRGIDAVLYLEAVKAIYQKGYQWIDGSVTSENNPIVNLIAKHLGAEQYKHYRVYKMNL